MDKRKSKHVLLIVEDDEDDYFFITSTLKNTGLDCDVRWVKDGEEAMDYLLRQKEWQDPQKSPIPSLIILDINMPKKNGLEVLLEMKETSTLKNLFTIIFTSSKNKANIASAYDLGANSYIQKPSQLDEFTEGMHRILEYWFNWVEYPINVAEA